MAEWVVYDCFQRILDNLWKETMAMDGLRRCPFCDGFRVEAKVSWGYYVRCRACIATGGVEDSPQKARDKWNCRAPRSEQTEAQRDLELIREKTKVDTLDDGWKAMVRTVIRLAEKEE